MRGNLRERDCGETRGERKDRITVDNGARARDGHAPCLAFTKPRAFYESARKGDGIKMKKRCTNTISGRAESRMDKRKREKEKDREHKNIRRTGRWVTGATSSCIFKELAVAFVHVDSQEDPHPLSKCIAFFSSHSTALLHNIHFIVNPSLPLRSRIFHNLTNYFSYP